MIALLVAVSLVFGGCGDTDDGSDGSVGTPTGPATPVDDQAPLGKAEYLARATRVCRRLSFVPRPVGDAFRARPRILERPYELLNEIHAPIVGELDALTPPPEDAAQIARLTKLQHQRLDAIRDVAEGFRDFQRGEADAASVNKAIRRHSDLDVMINEVAHRYGLPRCSPVGSFVEPTGDG